MVGDSLILSSLIPIPFSILQDSYQLVQAPMNEEYSVTVKMFRDGNQWAALLVRISPWELRVLVIR